MGEPIIASLVAGGLALTMLIWNWQMMEQQKRRGRRAFRDAAEAGAARAKSKAAAAKLAARAVVPAAPRVVSSRSCVKLEPLLECPANSPVDANLSPLFLKTLRERLETACLSPDDCLDMPDSSGTPRAVGTGFFKDGCETAELAGRVWPNMAVEPRVPLAVSHMDVALL